MSQMEAEVQQVYKRVHTRLVTHCKHLSTPYRVLLLLSNSREKIIAQLRSDIHGRIIPDSQWCRDRYYFRCALDVPCMCTCVPALEEMIF